MCPPIRPFVLPPTLSFTNPAVHPSVRLPSQPPCQRPVRFGSAPSALPAPRLPCQHPIWPASIPPTLPASRPPHRPVRLPILPFSTST
eukprot:352662-Chlamydomonas_euryale.AAC.1